MSNSSVLDSNTEDVILNRVDASNTEDLGGTRQYEHVRQSVLQTRV